MKEIKNIHSRKIFQWFPEILAKYLFNQIEQNYTYSILQNICIQNKNTILKNTTNHSISAAPARHWAPGRGKGLSPTLSGRTSVFIIP